MSVVRFAVCMVGLGFFISMLGGCQTDSPGVKNVAGTYTAMVDASPDKVAKAAKNAVDDLKLMYVASTATKVDGKVTARTAQNETVTIDIEQAGENVSKVNIRVGTVGDEAVSKQILDRIKHHLH